MKLSLKQIEKINRIKERIEKFHYGLGQADKDISFLIRMIDMQRKLEKP